jgi:putative hydroxymethylpyrimidine transport system substrate-binding protein
MRAIAYSAALVAACVLTGSMAAAQTCPEGPAETKAVTVMADWLPWTGQAPFWEAKQKGFYTQEGIEVDIKAPPNPADTIKLVATKRVQYSITYVPDVMLARETGIPVSSIAVVLSRINSGLIVLPEKKVTTASQLKGMTIGVGAKADAQAFFRTLLATAGLKREDVKVVDPGYAHVQMLLAGKLDAINGLGHVELLAINSRLRAAGKPEATFLRYTDYGVPMMYNLVVAANDEWAKANPLTTCRFLRASMKGWHSAMANPDYVNKFITDARPGVYSYEENVEKWNVMKPLWQDSKGRIFAQDAETWINAQKWALSSKLITDPVQPPESYFTNAYMPK